MAYFISSVGIPVFLHYCGGELETVNYVIKGNTCCGMNEDAMSMDDDCCKDENLVIKNNPDFTLKQHNNYDLVKTFCNLFYISTPFLETTFKTSKDLNIAFNEAPPPRLQNASIISTSVLRI